MHDLTGVRTLIRRCLSLGPRSGAVFVLQTVKRVLHLRNSWIARPLTDCRHVVFVCHGNILRSPFAAALFARSMGGETSPAVVVGSAGLRARAGRFADPRGFAAASVYGIDLAPHRARLLTRDIVRAADAVIVMDFANEADYLARFPEFRAKLRLLGAFDPRPRAAVEIPDPYMLEGDGVERSYADIVRCVEGLYDSMRPRARPALTVRSPHTRPLPGADQPAHVDVGRPFVR